MSGLLVLVLGVWGALVPFIGPYFGYAFASHATWMYDSNRLWLDVLPGGAAVIAGLLMMGASTRRAGILAAWIGLAAGGWFLAGPVVSTLWGHGAATPIGRPLGGQTRQAFELLGYFYALGGVIIALVSFAGGRFSARPAVEASTGTVSAEQFHPAGYAEAAPAGATVADAPSTVAYPPRATAVRRRRSPLLRRGRRSATSVRG
ncbi:MAG TPA: hypothetical protein VHX66_04365 [Solirubrobacteraceae bacterium]|jgi:hypothetical protein|nr:hypothetical protein [Solirubrobacteraceae bacterium]